MIIVGLVFALLLAFVKNINQGANRFLAFALVSMVLWMARVLLVDIRPGSYLPFQSLLALGPLLYFYVLKITQPKYKFRRMDILHFGPLLLEQAMLPFQQLNPILQLLIFISIIIYLYQSYKLILHFYTRQPIVEMDRSRLEFRWLRRLLVATALLWCLWVVWSAVDYFVYGDRSGGHGYYLFYIFFAVIIIWTAVAAFLRPQAAAMVQAPSNKHLVPSEVRAKGIFLKKAMDRHRYFEDSFQTSTYEIETC
ncbi:MAG TPA: hypothetical protein VG738_06625 [Chitinophagaceae bacterium]|nr:hypothetical protein [Chitinophagaceae bacterium]